MATAFRRVLILCVDRDDDIEQVTGIKTPIIGRRKVLSAAITFAIRNPEDSDANAVFAAVQLYDFLKKSLGEENVEVVILAGLPGEGIEADLKIAKELDEVLSKFKAEGVILVTDGPTDEQVLPVIQSKVPVLSVKRVIVQQSKSVEEFFVIISRYLLKAFTEEKFRKYSLGIPGILLVIYSILSALNIALSYIWYVVAIVLGIALTVRGFSLDLKIKNFWSQKPVTLIAVVAATIVWFIAMLLYNSYALETSKPVLLNTLLKEISSPLLLVDLFFIPAIIISIGWLADQLLNPHGKISWRDVVLVTFLLLSRPIIVEGLKVLKGEGDIVYLLYWTIITLIFSSAIGGLLLMKERIKFHLKLL